MVTAVRMHEPRITVGEEPEKCVLRPARLANAVRWFPAREDVAATDAGPVSGAALEAERMEGARVHGDYLLWSVDQFSPSGCAPDYGPHGHRLEGARLVPTLLHMGALQSGGPDFKVLWGAALAWTAGGTRGDKISKCILPCRFFTARAWANGPVKIFQGESPPP